ncbi:hypothetical protein OIU84_027029 [Salix udensis]|uniref:Uncharacterized protein n=1 Tax=Salix udensis TaxID=889485 RepID=A0AAD6KEN2_9ROSI|nr:hypothetical protein OIU84_027029 [Salix udensis]
MFGWHPSGASPRVLKFHHQIHLQRVEAPLREGQHEFTKEECSAIFFICFPVSTSHALTVLSGLAVIIWDPSVVQ